MDMNTSNKMNETILIIVIPGQCPRDKSPNNCDIVKANATQSKPYKAKKKNKIRA